jgi:HEAT repeat protein
MWFGLNRVRVSDETTPERQQWAEAGRVAQAAHSREDLARLVSSHGDYRVRYQAIPRLRARFPDDDETLEALAAASHDPEAAVRDAAVMALRSMTQAAAADLIADRLTDEEFDVRLTAAESLASLGDARAPSDPEAFALDGMVAPDLE